MTPNIPPPPMDTARATWIATIWEGFRNQRLTRAWRDALLQLERFKTADGTLCPAHASIAQAAQCSPSTVQRALDAAHGLGWVQWTKRYIRVGTRWLRTSNGYRLTPPGPAAVPLPPNPRRPYASVLRAGSVRALVAALANGQIADGAKTTIQTGLRSADGGGLRARLEPHPPVRTVQEQLALLLSG